MFSDKHSKEGHKFFGKTGPFKAIFAGKILESRKGRDA